MENVMMDGHMTDRQADRIVKVELEFWLRIRNNSLNLVNMLN